MLERIGQYEVLDILGDGGMGTVYRARDPRFDRLVAVKLLHGHFQRDSSVAERFKSEAVIQAKLNHPNIVAVYDFVIDANYLAIVLEYIDGQALSELIEGRGGPLQTERSVALLSQVLKAIGFAHDQGLVHRDIKPSNIMVLQLGDEEIAKVLDFGIAKILGSEKMRTVAGSALGTLAYMSPEQIKNPNQVTAAADIYSLGIALYETLTGVVPFDGETEYDMMVRIVDQVPTPPSRVAAAVPAALDAVVLRALEKDPSRRFSSCSEFRRALHAALPGASWCSDSAPGTMPRVAPVPPLRSTPPPLRSTPPPIKAPSAPAKSLADLIDQYVGRVGTRLARGDLKKAKQILEEAISRCGEREEFNVVRELVEQAGERDLAKLRKVAVEHLENGRLDDAEGILDTAVLRHGESKSLAKLAARVREAREEEALTRLVEIVQTSIENEEWADAARTLEEAKESYGALDELKALSSDLDAARQELLAEFSARIEASLEGEDVETAEELLVEVETRCGKSEALADLGQRIEKARQNRIEKHVEAIRRHLDKGELEAVGSALANAARACGLLDEFSKLADELAELKLRARISEAAAAISRAFDEGDLDGAEEELRKAQDTCGEHDELERLAERLAGERKRQRLEVEHARKFLAACKKVEAHLDMGHVKEARICFDRIVIEQDGSEELEELGEQVAQAEQLALKRAEKISVSLASAEEHLAAEQLEEAVAALDEVFSIEAEQPEARALLARVENIVAEQREQRRLSEEIQHASVRFGDALAGEDLDEAARVLELADALWAGEQIWQSMRGELNEQFEKAQKARVSTLLSEALSGEYSFLDAIERLEQALKLSPDNTKVEQVLERMREAYEAAITEEKRARERAQALSSITAMIDAGELDRARRFIEIAERDTNSELLEARKVLAEAEQKAKERMTRVSELVDRARSLRVADELEEALEALEEAIGLAPDHWEVKTLLDLTVSGLRARAEETRVQQELDAVAANIEKSLFRGELDSARRALEIAERLFSGRKELKMLRKRLTQLRIAEERKST